MSSSERNIIFPNEKHKLNLWSYFIKFSIPFSKEYMEFIKYPEENSGEYLISKLINTKEKF